MNELDFLNLNSDGIPGVLIMANNREHDVALVEVHGKFVTGLVAHHLWACLYQENPTSNKLTLILDNQRFVKEKTDKKRIFLDQECFVKTKHRFFANINEISAMDIAHCPYFTTDPRIGDQINIQLFLDKMKDFEEYFNPAKGIFENHFDNPIKLIQEEKDSEDENN